ncbi:hypothetical protein Ppa06_40670 [Planomonospora parontospora subsp. parontospora]|uniref:Fibronectin type-III domain-containing protein n=2 Tax=Planomonospora parontospora TaxID=58119 RepID=A0AA37BJ63_9ACTN|nr:LamG domain-containing protein [Planomonospora parontospora]GGK78870.1 hypothetical protein GCM10010126_42880 [Planomonospora parontospora]GII10269.1 hypothetical protein Ppa06_40670 [Planomonospora parontospora subsp. parontospora]
MGKHGKILAACAGLLLGTTLLSAPQAALAAADPVPVAAYGMEEGAGTVIGDASGQGHTGTSASGLPITWAGGKYGRAIALDRRSRVTVPDVPSLRLTSAMTVEAWVNPDTDPVSGGLTVSKGSYGFSATTATVGTSPAGRVTFRPLPARTWSHLAATYDGQALRVYVNGALVASQPAQGAIGVGATPLGIWGTGLIDEVRIYDTALSEAQINADMAAPVAGGSLNGPPTAPEALTAVPGYGKTVLSWQASTDDDGIAGYEVHRSARADFTPTGSTLLGTVTTTSYTDVPKYRDTYHYRVRAMDTSHRLGPLSEPASAKAMEPDSPPGAPWGVRAYGHGGWATVWWGGVSDDHPVHTWEIHRSTASGFAPSAATLLALVDSPPYEYMDTVQEPGTYYYRVIGVDSAGQRGTPSEEQRAAVGPAPDLSQTLAAAYGMNEGGGTTVRDGSGRGNTGTAYGAGWADGRFGTSVEFSAGGAVLVPSSKSLGMTTGITMSAWVNPTRSKTSETILRRGSLQETLELFTAKSSAPYGPHVHASDRMNSTVTVPSGPSLPTGVWSHVAAVLEGETAVLYVNGEVARMVRWSPHLTEETGQLKIGGDGLSPFVGRVDEVKTYNAALSPSQIKADMETPVP